MKEEKEDMTIGNAWMSRDALVGGWGGRGNDDENDLDIPTVRSDSYVCFKMTKK